MKNKKIGFKDQQVHQIWVTISCLFLLGFFLSCSKNEDSLSAGSNLGDQPPYRNSVDQWILENFTKPYNIEVVYKWQESLVDQSKYVFPPDLSKVIPALEVVKKVWIEPYEKVGGRDFVKKIAPRQLVLVGGLSVNDNGTVTLGVAAGGKRIVLFGVNDLNIKSISSVTQFIKTIQHEYVHTLNQTKPFDRESWSKITPNYTGDWYNFTDLKAQELGFVTAYARSNEDEDFAEMSSELLIRNRADWNKLVEGIAATPRALVRSKEKIMAEYFLDNLQVNVFALQDTAYSAVIRLTK